jgi:glycosyltransferase involved in cell wall biosynthesis
VIAERAAFAVGLESISAALPRVSIVITCYNHARFLGDAIRSALDQTIDRVEVIVVDDGSKDDTAEVAGAFPQVRYLFQRNQGLAAARNSGLAISNGDYVCFLDADDMLLPEAIESGLKAFEQHPECGFVYGDSCDVDVSGAALSGPRGQRVEKDHYRALLEGNFIGMHATVLYRCEALRSAGGFDVRLRRCEDYEIYLRIARQFPVREHHGLVAYYRQHDSNMSRDHGAMLDAAVAVLRMQKPHFGRRPEFRRAARKGIAIWRDYYGELLVEDFKYHVETSGFGRRTAQLLRDLSLKSPRTLAAYVRGAAARRLDRLRKRCLPPRRVNFGDLRRLSPFSRQFGYDRGTPVDRYYIEQFLSGEALHIRGAVLEIGNAAYTQRFGGDRVTSSDVLHVVPGTQGATITGDLTCADHIPSNSFDCIILTQTLHFIFDLRAAMATIRRILRPGGCVLVTTPGISQTCRDQADLESDSWRFTASSAARLFREYFDEAQTEVHSYGNVLTASAFLYGLAAAELQPRELAHHDRDYPLVIGVKAMKERI